MAFAVDRYLKLAVHGALATGKVVPCRDAGSGTAKKWRQAAVVVASLQAPDGKNRMQRTARQVIVPLCLR